MKQVVRRAIDRRGRVVVLDLPAPQVGPDQVLVHNRFSLISTGTEMTTLSKTPLELARQTISDPWMRHVVKQTVFATGIGQTARRVWYEMLTPREIGYSGAGTVLAVGDAVDGFKVGDTAAFAATGHAELVAPTINHITAVPAGVDLRHAAFVTVGGIAVHALRRADLQFGEVVAIYGLGLVGQLAARVAKAAGCVVVGIDISSRANDLATDAGVDLVVNPADPDWKRRVLDFTGKHGVDATIICASSDSNEIVNSSMEITRRQGRVVIVGYVRLDIHPKNFLYREIDLRYSRAYGPGSYHAGYEKGRIDYPYGYVRWTEKRNLEEFVRLIGAGAIDVEPLIGGVYDIDDAQRAFEAIRNRELPGIAALIRYADDVDTTPTLEVRPRPRAAGKVGIALIGCGNHVLGKHLPNLQAMPDVEIRGIASATGKNATMVAARVGATVVTTDVDEVIADPAADAAMVCSAQPEHFEHIMKAIDGGKAVFVEKPMVTRVEDFARVLRRMQDRPVLFTLGLNRRYSPIVRRLRDALDGPVDSVEYTITQPYLPPDHWTIDPIDGGGRLITEGEHFIDLCHLLIDRPPISVFAQALGREPEDLRTLTNFAITIRYEGAVGNIVFNESGTARYPREKVTVFARGQVATLDDFAKLTVHGRHVRNAGSGLRKSMGHAEELRQFVAAIRGEPNSLLTWDDAARATLSMFAAEESIRTGEAVRLDEFRRRLLDATSGVDDDGSTPAP